ncbi:hypothetical protein D3C71_1617510 [compost metagenome]
MDVCAMSIVAAPPKYAVLATAKVDCIVVALLITAVPAMNVLPLKDLTVNILWVAPPDP